MVLKRQRFEDSGSDKTEKRGSKRQRSDARDDEEGESLDEFDGEDEGENTGYVPLPFVVNLFPPKKSNRPIDLGEGIEPEPPRMHTKNRLII